MMCHSTLAQVFVRVIPCMCRALEWLSVLSSTLALHSPIFHFILLNCDFYLFLFHVDVLGARSLVHFALWESGPLANNVPLTGYEPNFFDDFHCSETSEIFSRSHPATRDPRTCMTRRSVTTPSAERSPHHCSLRSEKNQRAVDKLIILLKKVCCQVSRCLFVTQERVDPCMNLVR